MIRTKTKWGYINSSGPLGKDLRELLEMGVLRAKIKAIESLTIRNGWGGSRVVSALEYLNQQEGNMRSSVTLGAEYRDKVTGFKGVCTGYCMYLSGCNQALLIPRMGKDGKSPDGGWYDVQRLERAGKKIISLDNTETPGCDMAAPIR